MNDVQRSDETSYRVLPVYPGDQRPSIEPAMSRLSRASERFNELASVVDRLHRRAAARPMTLRVPRVDVDAGVLANVQLRWRHDGDDQDLHQECRLLTGEILYHLRTALDYAAYHLVWEDRGTPYEQTQFPVEWQEKRWAATVERRLPGLSADHVAIVRERQPFAGCEWMKSLQRMSNSDKHRSTLRLAAGPGASFRLSASTVVQSDPEDPNWCLIQSTPQVGIETDDAKPLMDTLLLLFTEVVQTVQEMAAELDGDRGLNLTVG